MQCSGALSFCHQITCAHSKRRVRRASLCTFDVSKHGLRSASHQCPRLFKVFCLNHQISIRKTWIVGFESKDEIGRFLGTDGSLPGSNGPIGSIGFRRKGSSEIGKSHEFILETEFVHRGGSDAGMKLHHTVHLRPGRDGAKGLVQIEFLNSKMCLLRHCGLD